MSRVIFGDDVAALQQAVRASDARIKELERENERLQKQVKKLSNMNRQMRQRVKSQAGQLRAEKARNISLRGAIKRAKIKIRKLKRIVAIKPIFHRTRAQYLSEQKPSFITRLIQRLHDSYSDWQTEWDGVMLQALMGLDWDEIDAIMRMIGLDSMYYESNGYSVNRGATGRAIYDYFVQFIPQQAA